MAALKKREKVTYHTFLFHDGEDCRAFEFMGAHLEKRGRLSGAVFRVLAPNALAVSVVGDVNGRDIDQNPMERVSVGIWETFVPGLSEGDSYHYRIETRDGRILRKADPYAFCRELGPKAASKLFAFEAYEWNDAQWLKNRKRNSPYDHPVNIYELHPGSWQRAADGGFFTYAELAAWLIPYVKEMGYTHIELMPVNEHPEDSPLGYACTGYFAPDRRFGTPRDFMRFVDSCHQSGLGVILDWVPACFSKDESFLAGFDGGSLYEKTEPKKRARGAPKTLAFDFERREVCSFLLSSAMFWLEHYHIDGLRAADVSAMLYPDAGSPGFTLDENGQNADKAAVELLKKLNDRVLSEFPDVMMIAEERRSFPRVTDPPCVGGLGFTFKWDVGFIDDTLDYMRASPDSRGAVHDKLTGSMLYALSENFILPFSHHESMRGQKSMLGKMPGEYEEKFANLRALYSYIMARPGKKMTFMGNEFGHFREWDADLALDWSLLDYDMHRKIRDYSKALNAFYLAHPALWEKDFDLAGFEWLESGDRENSVVAFRRMGKKKNEVIAVFNFGDRARKGFRLGVPDAGVYTEALNSDKKAFGGSGFLNRGKIPTESIPADGKKQSIRLNLPPLSAVFLVKAEANGKEKARAK